MMSHNFQRRTHDRLGRSDGRREGNVGAPLEITRAVPMCTRLPVQYTCYSSSERRSWGPKNHKTHTCCWKDATGTDGGTERPGNTGDCRCRATTSGEVSGCSSRRCTPLTVARYPRGETEREKPLWRRKAVMCLYTTIYVGKRQRRTH